MIMKIFTLCVVLISTSLCLNLNLKSSLKQNSEEELLINGDFSLAILPEGEDYVFLEKLVGWEVREGDQVEVGNLYVYRREVPPELEGVKGIEIDGKDNDAICQSFILSESDSKKLRIKFIYFAPDYKRKSSGVIVTFNGVPILVVEPAEDYKIYHFQLEINGVTGTNSIGVEGTGQPDGYGMVLTNFSITKINGQIEEIC